MITETMRGGHSHGDPSLECTIWRCRFPQERFLCSTRLTDGSCCVLPSGHAGEPDEHENENRVSLSADPRFAQPEWTTTRAVNYVIEIKVRDLPWRQVDNAGDVTEEQGRQRLAIWANGPTKSPFRLVKRTAVITDEVLDSSQP